MVQQLNWTLNMDIWRGKFPEALSRARRTLNASFLDFTHSFQTSLYWQGLLPHYSSTDCKHIRVSSFSPTQCSTGLNASPDLVFIPLDERTHQFVYITMAYDGI